MESKDKLRVLLQHWIDHNNGHTQEFDKWRQKALNEGEESIATHIAQAISEMDKANAALQKALEDAGGPSDDGHHHHHHHH